MTKDKALSENTEKQLAKAFAPESLVITKVDGLTNIAPAIRAEAGVPDINSGNWGAIENMETTDLLVPKIYHQQSMSALRKAGKAQEGDFCDSLTGKILATRDVPLEVIIFGSYKTMIVSKAFFDKGQEKYKMEKIITIIPENARDWANKPFFEETPEGKFKYGLHYNFYCLLPSCLNELPFVLSLGSTKTKAAKKINTIIFMLSQQRLPSAAIVFELRSVAEKNDTNDWYGIEVSQGRKSTQEELMRAHAWYVKSKSQKFVAAEEGDTNLDDDIPF